MNSSLQPVFIFSSSWRSGSTLLQRYITSTDEVLVWGETGGALNALADALNGWEKITSVRSRRVPGRLAGKGEEVYRKFVSAPKNERAGIWIANLSPPYEDILASVRDMIGGLFAARAMSLGYPRFGFKETRCDLTTARRMQELFPDARFLFLVRNPIDVMLSIKRRNWIGRPAGHATLKYYAEHWRSRAMQFRQADFGLSLRYEDFIAKPELQLKVLEYLNISARPTGDFIESSRVDWKVANRSQLTHWEQARLKYWLAPEMKQWGY